MSRTHTNAASPVWIAHPPVLSEPAIAQLQELLQNEEPKALRAVESALAIAIDGRDHLDHIPRAADYVSAFTQIRAEAYALSDHLDEWSGYFTDQADALGANIEELQQRLTTLLDVSNTVIRENKERTSKGAPKNTALMETIRRLRLAFRKHYAGIRDERQRRGAFEKLAKWEQKEREFVKVALLDTGADRGRLEKTLPRLLRDPRSDPDAESAVRLVP